MPPELDVTIAEVVQVLRECRSILFVTGAGVSAESGLPTYRGIGGLYDVEVTEDGLPIEQILSGSMLVSQPELTWKYLANIADVARFARPNRAHEVIVEMERRFPRVWTLTQNVDGLHRMAGTQNLIEIHGNMRSLSCMSCGSRMAVDLEATLDLPPYCSDCGSIMRPDVVFFEEMLPLAAVTTLQLQMAEGFSVVFSVGTSSQFPYIQEPVVRAGSWSAVTIEINPDETEVSHVVDYRLPLGAAAALDEIWRHFLESETAPGRL